MNYLPHKGSTTWVPDPALRYSLRPARVACRYPSAGFASFSTSSPSLLTRRAPGRPRAPTHRNHPTQPDEASSAGRVLSCFQPHLVISPPRPRSAYVAETERDVEQHSVRGGGVGERTARKRTAAMVTPEVNVQHRWQGFTRLSAQELAGECMRVRLGSRRGRSLGCLL